MNASYTIFEKTLSGLSQGLQIRHIASFDLKTCNSSEIAAEVLEQYPGFDQIPVKENDCVVGVLERNPSQGKFVRNQMRRLDDSILVSADEPLLDFIPFMAEEPYYRVVLSGTCVDGVVTRSDLLKLPVRLLSFAMVTYLELLMKEIISLNLQNADAWLSLLSEGRQKKIFNKLAVYQEKRMDPPILELTDFCDKKTILKRHLKLSSDFNNDLDDIENLRNLIVHASNYAPSESELQMFIINLQKARHWIEELRMYIG